jgi:dipeptidyl aminopeptidase/acylaminoacyl peptidase
MSRLLITLLAAAALFAGPADGTVVQDRPYPVPRFEQATGMAPYATAEEYAEAANDQRYEMGRVVYNSDGLPVVAYTYYVKGDSTPRPTVVFNRGGYVQPDIGHQMLPMFHRFAEMGFSSIAPMYRGSAGAPGRDEMGGEDVHDVMNVRLLAGSLPFVDASNFFLYGEGRGGVMAMLAARAGFPARAVATYGAFTDLEALLKGPVNSIGTAAPQVWPTLARDRARIVAERSAVAWSDSIRSPLLLMHGSADRDINATQALALAQVMQQLGKEYQLLIYAGDNNTLTRNRVARDRAAADWFRAHMEK